jgi:DNA-binding transcriptional LysR family regulator
MNFSELKTFVETTRRGSFSDAARALGLTQPAVTRQIQRLERELRLQLLQRGEGGVVPTQAGEHLLDYAERALTENERLFQRLGLMREEVAGNLSIAASTIPREFLVPHLLAEFGRLHPAVEASVSVQDTQDVIAQLLEGQADVGFVGAIVDRSQLTFIKIGEDEIVLVVYPEHPYYQRSFVRLSELEGQAFVMREQGSGTMRSVYSLLEAQGLSLPRHRVSAVLSTTRAVVSAIEAGLGIAFVSSNALTNEPRSGHAKAVLIEGVSLRRDLFFVHDANHLDTRLIKEFVEFVTEASQTARNA